MYQQKVKTHERTLKSLRSNHGRERKKVADTEKSIGRLQKQARSAGNDSMRANYERRAETKQRELERARDAEVKLSTKISDTESDLAKSKNKLADAEEKERRRKEQKGDQERRVREQAQKRDEARRQSQDRAAAQRRVAAEAARDTQITTLEHRTTELQLQLAAAERRDAPPEISVLFLASSPEDQTTLRLDRESREIQKRVRESDHRESIIFEWRLATQLTDLIQALNEVKPNILHFSGHGEDEALLFEDESEQTTVLSNDQLGRLLGVGGTHIRLAIFNSCNSRSQAQLATDHIDIAIGMSASIGDESAKIFAGQLYNSLGFGKSVEDAFREATLQVELEGEIDHDVPELFCRAGVDAETVVLVNPED